MKKYIQGFICSLHEKSFPPPHFFTFLFFAPSIYDSELKDFFFLFQSFSTPSVGTKCKIQTPE